MTEANANKQKPSISARCYISSWKVGNGREWPSWKEKSSPESLLKNTRAHGYTYIFTLRWITIMEAFCRKSEVSPLAESSQSNVRLSRDGWRGEDTLPTPCRTTHLIHGTPSRCLLGGEMDSQPGRSSSKFYKGLLGGCPWDQPKC